MSAQRDGGSAFPLLPPLGPDGASAVGYPYVSAGMTLRDYFAAQAMNGLLAQSMGTAFGSDHKLAADYAYACADAMLDAKDAE